MALKNLCSSREKAMLLCGLRAEQRLVALEAANPQLYDAICQLPTAGFSSALTVETLEEALSYITDAEVLEQIAKHDARTNVQCAARHAVEKLRSSSLDRDARLTAEQTTRAVFDIEDLLEFAGAIGPMGRDEHTDWDVVCEKYQQASTPRKGVLLTLLRATAPKALCALFMQDIADGVFDRAADPSQEVFAVRLMSAWDGDVNAHVAAWLAPLLPSQRRKVLNGRMLDVDELEMFAAEGCWDVLLAKGFDYRDVVDRMLLGDPVKWPNALLVLDAGQLDDVIVEVIDALLHRGVGQIAKSYVEGSNWRQVGDRITDCALSAASNRALLRVASAPVVADALCSHRLSGADQRELVLACVAEQWVTTPEDIVSYAAGSPRANRTAEAVRLVDAVFDNIDRTISWDSWKTGWANDHMVERIAAACADSVTSWKVAFTLVDSGFCGTLADLEAAIADVTSSMEGPHTTG